MEGGNGSSHDEGESEMNIKFDHCDSCDSNRKSTKVPVITLFHYGDPVLTQCKRCAPKEFERQARRDIDAWLGGQD